VAWARRSSWPSAYSHWRGVPKKIRSLRSSELATDQPWSTSPSTLLTGTRTLSKKTSKYSPSPLRLTMGLMVTPGERRSISKKVMPAWRLRPEAVVRTSANIQFAPPASVVQIFWPLTTRSSPSRSARVRRLARSEPALGSEYPWHHMFSPLSTRGRWKAFCGGVP